MTPYGLWDAPATPLNLFKRRKTMGDYGKTTKYRTSFQVISDRMMAVEGPVHGQLALEAKPGAQTLVL